jgi:hypothetical protein
MLQSRDKKWFDMYREACFSQTLCIMRRPKAHVGILINDDWNALIFQFNEYYKHKAKEMLIGPSINYYGSSGYPIITLYHAWAKKRQQRRKMYARARRLIGEVLYFDE